MRHANLGIQMRGKGGNVAITEMQASDEAEPARLPPHPFDTIGANAYLRWKEWRSRAE